MVENKRGIKLDGKIFCVGLSIISCVILAFFVGFNFGETIVYTHFFYIPILLAGLWYQKKAIYVALFLGVVHIIVTYFAPPPLSLNEFGRAIMFMAVAYVIGIVSEKEATEANKLLESHEKLTKIVDGSSISTFVINSEHKITHWNTAIEMLTGTKREEVIGTDKQWISFYPAKRPVMADLLVDGAPESEFQEKYDDKYDKSSLIKGAYEGLDFFPTLGAEGKWLLFTAAPLRDPNGNPAGAIETLQDLTERKLAEEDRKRLLNELEAKNRELENFTYTVSHDLRSPLYAIQGFACLMSEELEQGNTENMGNSLKRIETSATKMDRLLKDTLKLSRIGRMTNPPENVPFGAIVKDALEQTAEHIKSSGAEISVATDLPAVFVDRMRIAEMLVNLITNSIKYRDEQRTPKIEIGYRVEGEDTVFFMKDNGIGIDPRQYEKVFELFYRGGSSGNGTGAGLAIVKRIIEVHGGRIWVESEIGKGCTICFTLPVRLDKNISLQ
jgi:signal transduction histidine kinase